jgi:L-serine dehydratase
MHGVFDIIGPIMIGPSSSHTAGAVRIGLMARKILGEEPVEAEIFFHGSFAQTYRGHGTDKAIIAGILGFAADDERIKKSLDIAFAKGLKYEFSTIELSEAHPNTAVVYLTGASGRRVKIIGSSVGGGNIMITNIDGYEVELAGKYHTLIIIHKDKPGAITRVTSILAEYGINVAFMKVARKMRGQEALMIIEADDELSAEIVERTAKAEGVEHSFAILPVMNK